MICPKNLSRWWCILLWAQNVSQLKILLQKKHWPSRKFRSKFPENLLVPSKMAGGDCRRPGPWRTRKRKRGNIGFVCQKWGWINGSRNTRWFEKKQLDRVPSKYVYTLSSSKDQSPRILFLALFSPSQLFSLSIFCHRHPFRCAIRMFFFPMNFVMGSESEVISTEQGKAAPNHIPAVFKWWYPSNLPAQGCQKSFQCVAFGNARLLDKKKEGEYSDFMV